MLAGASSAHPAEETPGFARYERAQARVDFTVCAPMRTLGLPRTDFQRNGFVDGPDGVGPATTFRVNGATATVMGACAGGTSACRRSTTDLARSMAYTTVSLPGSADRPTPTFVEVYSQATSLAQIKAFVRGLVPAT